MGKVIQTLLLSLMVLMALNAMSEGSTTLVSTGTNPRKYGTTAGDKPTVSAFMICASVVNMYLGNEILYVIRS